jgi:hypothetical protein
MYIALQLRPEENVYETWDFSKCGKTKSGFHYTRIVYYIVVRIEVCGCFGICQYCSLEWERCIQFCPCYCYVLLQVWDTVRRVRCLWEGNIKESLSVSLAIGMLNQEIVTFSGDTAVAHLDIQVHDSHSRKQHSVVVFSTRSSIVSSL